MQALTQQEMPAHVHYRILTGRDAVTGQHLAVPVLWTDRVRDTCPGCGQHVAVAVDCPVVLDPGAGQGGQVEPVDLTHRCGEWLGVDWTELPDGAGPAAILAEAQAMAAQRAEDVAALTEQVSTDTAADLGG
jgi:hypothetical protein